MKKLFVSITLLFAVVNLSVAQNVQKVNAASKLQVNPAQVNNHNTEVWNNAKQQAAKEADVMQQQLNLTPQQKEQIINVNTKADYTVLIMAQRGGANNPSTARRMSEFKNDSYKKILTADQFSKYQASPEANK